MQPSKNILQAWYRSLSGEKSTRSWYLFKPVQHSPRNLCCHEEHLALLRSMLSPAIPRLRSAPKTQKNICKLSFSYFPVILIFLSRLVSKTIYSVFAFLTYELNLWCSRTTQVAEFLSSFTLSPSLNHSSGESYTHLFPPLYSLVSFPFSFLIRSLAFSISL